MSATDRRHWLASALLAATFGCAQNPAPGGWLEPAREAVDDPYGAWIAVSEEGRGVAGEFLAIDRDSVFVLLPSGSVHAVSLDRVTGAQLAYYDAQPGALAIWTTVGSWSTISNGILLIFTLPTWIIGGSVATGSQSRAPLVSLDHEETAESGADSWAERWNAVRKYARFPGGLPPDLPRTLPTKRRQGTR